MEYNLPGCKQIVVHFENDDTKVKLIANEKFDVKINEKYIIITDDNTPNNFYIYNLSKLLGVYITRKE